MEPKVLASRSDDLQKMITEAQQMPGIIDVARAYGNFDELMLKSQEYLNIFTPKVVSSSSNGSI
jgi:hypothetical protein